MTSDKNHEATTSFFKEQNYFTYNPDYIHFFKQDMAPAATYEGKVYMEAKGKRSAQKEGNQRNTGVANTESAAARDRKQRQTEGVLTP